MAAVDDETQTLNHGDDPDLYGRVCGRCLIMAPTAR
jgi:hypothetical protein